MQLEKSRTFAQRIKEARALLGLDQPQTAAKWGFATATLSAWERGSRQPQGLYRQKLERILKRIEE